MSKYILEINNTNQFCCYNEVLIRNPCTVFTALYSKCDTLHLCLELCHDKLCAYFSWMCNSAIYNVNWSSQLWNLVFLAKDNPYTTVWTFLWRLLFYGPWHHTWGDIQKLAHSVSHRSGDWKNHMVLARWHFYTLCCICTDYMYRIFLWQWIGKLILHGSNTVQT
jgi:hypothetical protein